MTLIFENPLYPRSCGITTFIWPWRFSPTRHCSWNRSRRRNGLRSWTSKIICNSSKRLLKERKVNLTVLWFKFATDMETWGRLLGLGSEICGTILVSLSFLHHLIILLLSESLWNCLFSACLWCKGNNKTIFFFIVQFHSVLFLFRLARY